MKSNQLPYISIAEFRAILQEELQDFLALLPNDKIKNKQIDNQLIDLKSAAQFLALRPSEVYHEVCLGRLGYERKNGKYYFQIKALTQFKTRQEKNRRDGSSQMTRQR